LHKPVKGAADEKRMRQMVALLSETELTEMVSEEHENKLQKWGLHKPVYTFKLTNPKWDSPVEIMMSPILEASGAFYVVRSDARWVGRFASDKFLQLDFDLNDVVDKRLFSFQLNKVRRWDIWDQRLGHLILEKKHGEFVMLAPQPAMVKEEVMYRSLKHFAYIEGETLLLPTHGEAPLASAPLEKWTTKMSFYDSKGKRLGALFLHKKEEDVLGSSSERSETFTISVQTLKYLPLSLDAWIVK